MALSPEERERAKEMAKIQAEEQRKLAMKTFGTVWKWTFIAMGVVIVLMLAMCSIG